MSKRATKKNEVKERARFLMAHLDEFLEDDFDFFEEIINLEVLEELKRMLEKECKSVNERILTYANQKDAMNTKMYGEELLLLQNLMKKLALVRKMYKRQRQLSKTQQTGIKNKQKKNNSTLPKEIIDHFNLDLIPNYEEMLPFSSLKQRELYAEILVRIKNGRFIEEYSTALYDMIPVEIEKALLKIEKLSIEEKNIISILTMDIISNKKHSLNSDDELANVEKVFLNKIMAEFKKMYTIPYQEQQIDTTPYYNILISLLNEDYNYPYIEKLIKHNPKFLSARKNGKSIVLHLVEEFIYHYRQKLMNHKNDWIEPQFYKKIILLMFEEGLALSQEEVIEFFRKLEEFKEYASQKRYQALKEVPSDIAEIEQAYERKIERNNPQQEKINREIKYLKQARIKDTVLAFIRKKYPYYEAFKFSRINNYAFSITYQDDGSINFHIHVLDTSSFIEKDGVLYETMKKSDVAIPTMHDEQMYPVMTFTYTLSENKISNLKVSSSTILVRKEYQEKDLDNYRDISELKMMIAFLKRLTQVKNIDADIYFQEGMNNIINTCLNMDITKSFKENKMPFIWKGKLNNAEEIIRENHNAICTELMNIKKEEAHTIFALLDETPSTFYTPKNTGTLELDSTKFLGMYLLETIHDIQTGTYDIGKVQEELKELLKVLNNNEKGYYPTCAEQEDLKLLRTIHYEYHKNRRDNSN